MRRNEPARGRQIHLRDDVVVGRVADDVAELGLRELVGDLAELLLELVDRDHRHTGREQLLDHIAAGRPGAAHDDVVLHSFDPFLEASREQDVLEIAFDDERGDGRREEHDRAGAEHEQEDGEPAGAFDLVHPRQDLGVADRRDGDDGHVEAVAELPAGATAADQVVAEAAAEHDDDDREEPISHPLGERHVNAR
jgi:hypothetical protein